MAHFPVPIEDPSMPSCSIIIPVYNLAALTRQCLDHLLHKSPLPDDVEVVVVDDGSRDETPKCLAEFEGRIRVVTHPRNLGYATACNDGAAVATGDQFVFLNNDTIPVEGWLAALTRYASAHPGVGAVGSKLLYPDGTIQHAGIAFDQDRQPRHIYVGFPGDHPAVNKPRRMQMVTGGCVLIPREVFQRAGGFDASYVNGFEDVDLCLTIGAMGLEVHYLPESVLFHLESVSERPVDHDSANRRLFLDRWKDRVVVDDWRYYLEDGLIRIIYPGTAYCPLTVSIAPILGLADEKARALETNRLLHRRSEQVRTLLKDNISLRLNALT